MVYLPRRSWVGGRNVRVEWKRVESFPKCFGSGLLATRMMGLFVEAPRFISAGTNPSSS